VFVENSSPFSGKPGTGCEMLGSGKGKGCSILQGSVFNKLFRLGKPLFVVFRRNIVGIVVDLLTIL